MTTTARDTYLQQLLLSLRVREVPGPDIREWLDEVTAHLDDSGEEPLEVSGPPTNSRFGWSRAADRAPRPGSVGVRRRSPQGWWTGCW